MESITYKCVVDPRDTIDFEIEKNYPTNGEKCIYIRSSSNKGMYLNDEDVSKLANFFKDYLTNKLLKGE